MRSDRAITCVTAAVILLLGAALIAGGAIGIAHDLLDEQRSAPVVRLGVLLVVALGMSRAVRKLRRLP